MESKFRLKDRFISLFRRPALLLSANCGGRRSNTPGGKEKKNNKKEIRVRENGKLYMTEERVDQEGRTCPPSSPSKIYRRHYYYFKEEEKTRTTKQKKTKKKKMMTRSKRRQLFSSSEMESSDDYGFFSSHEESEEANKEEEDIETFFSSRSFSSDFYKKAKKVKPFSRRSPPLRRREKKSRGVWVDDGFQPLFSISRSRVEEEEEEACFAVIKNSNDPYARKVKSFSRRSPPLRRREKKSRGIWVNDGFQPLFSISRSRVEEEEEEACFAVIKNSSDPYGDFQSSMVEMIVERQIFGAGELRWLLRSYLSLNSVQNHPFILEAFVDISQVLFGC